MRKPSLLSKLCLLFGKIFKGTRDDLLFSMTTIRSQMLTGEVAIQPSIDLTKKVEKALLGDTQDRVKSIMSGEVEL